MTDKAKLAWLLEAVNGAPMRNTQEARYKSEYLAELAVQLEAPDKSPDKSPDIDL